MVTISSVLRAMGARLNSIIERALELASSGRFATVEQVCRQLRADGYRRAMPEISREGVRVALDKRLQAANSFKTIK